MSLEVSPPELLTDHHEIADFSCGVPQLDEWLQRRALANQHSGGSRTFVLADADHRVLAYYALAAGAVAPADAPGAIRRNMPAPIPVIVLGRLAVDSRMQGRKYGAFMLRDAVLRAQLVAENAGVRAMIVHAMSDAARDFYLGYGFVPSPTDPMDLLLKLGA